MAKRKSNWSKMIEEAGFRIRIYERPNGAGVYFSFIIDGKKTQRSTRRTDRKAAEEYAREVVRLVARDRLLGRSGPVTLGEVFRAYFQHRAPLLRAAWKRAAKSRRRLFETAWMREKHVRDIGQSDVDYYAEQRRTGALKPAKSHVESVRPGTIEADLRWLSTVLRWAAGFKLDGRPLVDANPLAGLARPRSKNVRRPVASQDRYVRTLLHADAVDPAGRLACLLSLARYTGHRENAICRLHANDFLRTKVEVRAALSALGLDERQADHFSHGGLRWRAEADKMGRYSVTPLGSDARAALDEYLAKNPRVGEAWLFPAPKDSEKPIRKDLAGRWLMKAEELAELPSLSGGRWHPYRRLWATERRHLPAQDVAAAGGWSDTQVLTTIYQSAEPDKILEVVEFKA